jgi:all-trans-8'-apo-beta-carotenal 15,15'-oxygenase
MARISALASSSTATRAPADREAHAWRRNMHDVTAEHGFVPLEVRGQLPAGLQGTLYRNGPGTFSSFGRRYQHWFDGDGVISAVRFAGGSAEGAVRVVQSAELIAERRAGRSLYGAYGTKDRSLLHRLRGKTKNSANTSVMVWQGRLYAMVEACRPIELSVDDLTTLGERDLDGAVVRSFSAHPHYVPERRTAYNFGVRYGRRTALDLFELPERGPARRLAVLPLSGPTMIHDFIATPRHLVFFAPPLRLRILRLLAGLGSFADNLAWRPELGTEVLVVPIDDPNRVRRFTIDGFYQWHFANAFERDDRIVVDLVSYPDFASNRWLGDVVAGVPATSIGSRLHRALLDPAQGRVELTRLGDRSVEFPRIAGAALGRPYRWAYLGMHSDEGASHGLWDRLGKVDVERGTVEEIDLGPARFPSEPVFVRRGGDGEDDGWLLTLVYDAHVDRSYVAVLDARTPGAEPLAEVWFAEAIPFSFHGVWSGMNH